MPLPSLILLLSLILKQTTKADAAVRNLLMEPNRLKRIIRLREHAPSSDRTINPDANQLAVSDSLSPGPFRIRTDENGYILSGRTVSSDVRTIVLGDSFVECSFLHQEARICSLLEMMGAGAGKNVIGQVLNAGYSGSTTLNLLNCLLNKVLSKPPERLIFILPANDAYAHRYASTYWNTSEYYSPISPANSELASAELGGYESLSGEDCQRLVLLIAEACSLFSVEIVVGTFPHQRNYEAWPFLAKKYPSRNWFESVVSARRSLNDCIRVLCREKSIPFVDLELLLDGRVDCFYDELHMNEVGAGLVARSLYEFIASS